MKLLRTVLFGATASFALAAVATTASADGMRRDSLKDEGRAFSWTGFYFGAHAGGAWSDTSGIYDNGTNPGPVNLNTLNVNTAIAGAQVGYNAQFGSFVLGVEADASKGLSSDDRTVLCSALCTSTTLNASIEDLVSIRGRLGIASGNWLFYGTAGWGQAHYQFGAVQSPKIDSGPNGNISLRESGLVYGGGVELAVGRTGTFRIEYLHYGTGVRHNFGSQELVDTDVGDFIKFKDVEVVRAAINFRLYP